MTDAQESRAEAAFEDEFLAPLLEKIICGDCVALLGPGVCSVGEDADPLNRRLAHSLADDPMLAQDKRLVDRNNLRHVAQLYYRLYPDRYKLQMKAADFYRGFAGQSSSFHRDLAQLPFRLLLTATPDDLLFNALSQADTGKSPVRGFYNYDTRGSGGATLPEPSVAAPVVFHLYGHHENPRSLVLTENDLVQFVVKVVQGNPHLPDTIRAHMANPDTSFLFIGFGFQYWYLRVLLHVLNAYGPRNNMSLAIEEQSFFNSPQNGEAVAYYGSHSIEFQALPWADFARRLRALHGPAQTRPQPASPAIDAPTVFISYVHEDAARIAAMAERLRGHGINIWRDADNLRGGQYWEPALQVVIDREADYIVVAQSPAMVTQDRSYVFKEIDRALDTLKSINPDRRKLFLIPIKLAPCTGPSSLNALHQIDIPDDAAIDRLADLILRDWQALKAMAA